MCGEEDGTKKEPLLAKNSSDDVLRQAAEAKP